MKKKSIYRKRKRVKDSNWEKERDMEIVLTVLLDSSAIAERSVAIVRN